MFSLRLALLGGRLFFTLILSWGDTRPWSDRIKVKNSSSGRNIKAKLVKLSSGPKQIEFCGVALTRMHVFLVSARRLSAPVV